jgi:post-segregation antitoxin (ccd killing protein)
MAKRKITVTVDEELVDLARAFGDEKLSGIVNAALADHVERLGRLAALRQLLDDWEAEAGPVSAAARTEAAAAFDEVDGPARQATG